MFGLFKKNTRVNTTEVIDTIEAAVYAEIKHLGFRRHGRTLHRFVDGDISQVINFQCGQAYRGETHLMWVNLGIRVPECDIRSFDPEDDLKAYYHEYNCNMRSQLGTVKRKKMTTYDLRDPADKVIADILYQIKEYVLPAFDVLNSRLSILENRKKYPHFDTLNFHMIFLEEAMIWGRLGERKKAGEAFNSYYRKCKKQRSPKAHLEYLEKLAERLDIDLEK